MPYAVSIVAARSWTEQLDADEAAIVGQFMGALERDDDRSYDDLERDLRAIALDAPHARIALIAEGEERERLLHVVDAGRVGAYPLLGIFGVDHWLAVEIGAPKGFLGA